MSNHVRFARATRYPARSARVSVRVAAIGFATLLLAGCGASTQNRLLAGAAPSEPSSPTRPVGYSSVTAGYVSQRPVNPAPWRQRNEHVTPPPKSDH